MKDSNAKKEVLLKSTKTWDNKNYEKVIISNPEVSVLKIIIDVGEVLPMHKHDIINVAYIKKGTLTVTTDTNEQITVEEGKCLPEVVGKYHYGKNAGDIPVELIVFYVGERNSVLAVNK